MNRWRILGIVAVATTGIVAACGSSADSTFGDPNADSGVGSSGSSSFGGDPNADSASAPIDIAPLNPVVSATGAPVTEQFHAYLHGTTTEVPVTWTLDIGTLGPIGVSTGLFSGNGVVGGVAQVTATHGTAIATTSLTVNVALVDANGLSPADQALLTAGVPLSSDAAMKWLYPYDQTVFPRGLRSPLLQFAGNAPTQTLVRFKSQHFQYDAFFPASNPGQVKLDEARWTTITQSASGSDTIKVSITKKSGTIVTGPIDETWTVAPASLAGTVYYNTYNSVDMSANAGALLKVRPGSTVDAQVLASNCTVCHSVAANGQVITTGFQWGNGDPLQSGIISIDAMGNPTTAHAQNLGEYAFGALTPDATFMMTHSNQSGGLRGLTPLSGAYSKLIDPKTGIDTPGVKGWPANMQARMPSFSPDGKLIAYNDGTPPPANAPDLGQVLGAMTFDKATLTFTPLGTLWTDTKKVSWPAFLPDSKSIVFHAGDDFGTQNTFHADIEIVDVAGKARTYLPALNGFAGTDSTYGATYLPYGEAAEAHLNYEPTVLPVASGGYFWVVFTSRRTYGNSITPTTDPWGNAPGSTELSPRKKLWVAAIDINPTPGKDRSHPAFYLPGQGLATGNMRAFWALDPCHANGASCETGDQCCGGYCEDVTEPDGAMGFVCSDKPQGCAQIQDKCNVAADCCGAGAGVQCINGHCASPAPK